MILVYVLSSFSVDDRNTHPLLSTSASLLFNLSDFSSLAVLDFRVKTRERLKLRLKSYTDTQWDRPRESANKAGFQHLAALERFALEIGNTNCPRVEWKDVCVV